MGQVDESKFVEADVSVFFNSTFEHLLQTRSLGPEFSSSNNWRRFSIISSWLIFVPFA